LSIALRHALSDDGGMVGDPGLLSREFRTLVMAIRGPLEDELADRAASSTARRERARTLHRNFLQLLQVVNTLFDIRLSETVQRAGSESIDLAAQTTLIPMLRDAEPRARRAPQHPDPRGPVWAAELERTNQELEAFSYSVSHDLRGPLRAITGFSQVLLGDHAHALDRDGRELLAQIHGNARRMGAIVDDLLALSHAGRADLHREPVDLTLIARRVLANLRLAEPSRTVEISLGDGLTASCDGRLVTLALENLLANAWKFTGKRPHARISFEREAGDVFAVRDDGAGFDMEHADRLFEPFQRLHSASEFEGTGIGLAIVRRVIERHDGHVWAHAVVDEGTTVRFTLASGPS
jgi:signal transduction histidine kinase